MRAFSCRPVVPLLLALAAARCTTPSKDAAPSATAKGDAPPSGAVTASTAKAAEPNTTTTTTTKNSAAPEGGAVAAGAGPKVTDTIPTSQGDLRITPIVHGTVMLEHNGKFIYFDPWSEGKLNGLPKADFLFITDIHHDHLDQAAIGDVRKTGTVIVGPPAVAEKIPGIVVMKNGETKELGGVRVVAVPMYNKKRGPEAGKLFHDKGRGNGYVLTLGDKNVYVSGDTECTDEMKALKNIDVAFVCMNLPYTMSPSEAAECAKAFRPKILFPYHFRGSNLDELESALAGEQGIEVRKRTWY
jgi:L-ascorbate metabolism protein UlaG (beta-lactamase superfamily)